MNVNELSEKLKSVKTKDIQIIFRDANGNSYNAMGMFYGLNNEGTISNPQIGEEPNCVVVQLAKV